MTASDDKTSDRAAFREAMGNVHPLRQTHADPHLRRPKADPRFTRRMQENLTRDTLHDPIEMEPVASGEELLFSRPGIRHATFKKLRKGHFIVEHELDLHGYTSREARVALATFLNRCGHRGARCVHIIHGKGHGSSNQGPVLKNKVSAWLRQREDVLAFCPAQPKDGGTGAVYVLLRRKQNP